MCQTDKCVVAQGLKVVFIINLIIIDHSIMIQAFRFIEISKYDDGGQLMAAANLCLEAVKLLGKICVQLFTAIKVCIICILTLMVDLLQVFVFLIPPNLTYMKSLCIHLKSEKSSMLKYFCQPHILVKKSFSPRIIPKTKGLKENLSL